MFVVNKYTKWYFSIINRSTNNISEDYTEKHHIIPKCLGGSNRKENIAILTPKEHFVCHWLLTKMTFGESNRKLKYAFWRMTTNTKHTKRRLSALEYSVAKSHLISTIKGKTLEDIYGDRAKEIRKNMSNAQKGIAKPHSVSNLPKQNMSSKVWHVTHPDGTEETITNLSLFCKKHGLSQGNLSRYGKTKNFQATCIGKPSEVTD